MTPWRVAALVLGGWAAISASFALGCWWAGIRRDADAVTRLIDAHRQAVDDLIGALGVTSAHGGDCDAAFRAMAAIMLDQQVELFAFRRYVAEQEAAELVGEEAEEFLEQRGGGL